MALMLKKNMALMLKKNYGADAEKNHGANAEKITAIDIKNLIKPKHFFESMTVEDQGLFFLSLLNLAIIMT